MNGVSRQMLLLLLLLLRIIGEYIASEFRAPHLIPSIIEALAQVSGVQSSEGP